MPHPAAPSYLSTPDLAKPGQKGGTLIAEDVHSFLEHHDRLESGAYRPDGCLRCGRRLHVLDQRARKLRDQKDFAETLICRYRCRPCGAVWQVLPGFLARHLHRTWGAVQSALVAVGALERTGAEWQVRHKPGTVRRFLARLNASARVLTRILSPTRASVRKVLATLGLCCRRGELVEGLADSGETETARKLEDLACWIHCRLPGVRLL